jgi:hypothetical protein
LYRIIGIDLTGDGKALSSCDRHPAHASLRLGGGKADGHTAGTSKSLKEKKLKKYTFFFFFKGRLHGAFLMCLSMSDKPFDAEACNIGGHASATNGLSEMKTHIENALCNRPRRRFAIFYAKICWYSFNSPQRTCHLGDHTSKYKPGQTLLDFGVKKRI